MSKIEEFENLLRNKNKEEMKKILDSYKDTDEEFEKWKKEVLTFEHFEHSSDDDFSGDDWICDGERLRTAEDEDDIFEHAGQDDECNKELNSSDSE